MALWAWNVDDDSFTMDERGFELWGIPWRSAVTFEELSQHIHSADRDGVRTAFQATRALAGLYETDFRIIVADEVRWIAARGHGEDSGIVGRTMFGIFLDVTGRKQAEQGHELLAGEMSHRVKNLLAIAVGLTEITSRTTSSKEEMARELIQRLTALGRAHDLVGPLTKGGGSVALLGDLISVLLAPYDDPDVFKGRVRIAVERLRVGKAAASGLAMVIHELATNSLKYGSLSSATGTLDVSSHAEGNEICIHWLERGGPPVVNHARKRGFGSDLIDRSISRQLGGTADYQWSEQGLLVRIRLDHSKLTR